MREKRIRKRKNYAIWDRVEQGICLVLLVLSVLAAIKTVFVSLDIDESYALAVGYRLAAGERLFLDLWESHQLGGVFLAPFLWLYRMIAGTTDYIVIYARVIGTLIHILTGIYLYETAVKTGKMKKTFSLLLFFLHLNFLPKWVQCPEFELQQYWFVLLIFLCFYRCYKGEGIKWGYLVLSGVLLTAQMFSYPTLILLYPLYLPGIFRCGEESGKKKFGQSLLLTAGSAVFGISFLGYLCTYLTPEKFLESVGYIFQDESHTLVSTKVKWEIFGAQFLEILVSVLILSAVVAAAGTLLSYLKERELEKKERWQDVAYLTALIMLFAAGILQTAGCLLGDENQFFMMWRFFAVSLTGILVYLVDRTEDNRVCLWFGILPGFVTLLSVLIVTNMDVNTSMAKMYIGVIAVVWMLGKRYEAVEEEPEMPVSVRGTVKVWNVKKTMQWEKGLLWAGALVFLAGLFVCKLVQIRISGCTEATVMAPLKRVEAGPAKGIYMLEDTQAVLQDDYRVLTAELSAEDKLLYIGSENIVYLWTKAQTATPSTQGTNAYNEMFIHYYEEHPEKMPTVIAVDKELGENPAYYDSPQNHIIYEWMEQMGYQEVLDAAYMKLYRR